MPVWALILVACEATAHGDWAPRHGGVMNDGGEISFELVRRGGAIVAHVSDHGVPMQVAAGEPELLIDGRDGPHTARGISQGTTITFPSVQIHPADAIKLRVRFADGSIALGRFPAAAAAALASRGKGR